MGWGFSVFLTCVRPDHHVQPLGQSLIQVRLLRPCAINTACTLQLPHLLSILKDMVFAIRDQNAHCPRNGLHAISFLSEKLYSAPDQKFGIPFVSLLILIVI